MKTLYSILFLCLCAGLLYAKKATPYVQVSGATSYYIPSKSYIGIPKLQIGLPTFSASASVGRKMRINKKLSFSFQLGALAYQKAGQINTISKDASYQVNTKTLFATTAVKVEKKLGALTDIFTGVQLNKPIHTASEYKILTGQEFFKRADIAFATNNNTLQTNTRYNANAMIGFVHNLKSFKNKLAYSVQYNIGFIPYQAQLAQQQNAGSPTYYQGVQIGLIYKY